MLRETPVRRDNSFFPEEVYTPDEGAEVVGLGVAAILLISSLLYAIGEYDMPTIESKVFFKS